MTLPDDDIGPPSGMGGELDDELAELFAAERRRPGPPAGTASRVQVAVLATVAASAASTAAASSAVAVTATSSAVTTAAATTTSAALGGSALGGTFGSGAMVAAALAATVAGTVYVATADVDPPPPTAVEIVAPPTRPAPPEGLIVDVPAAATPAVTAVPTPPTAAPAAPKKPIVVEAAPTPAEAAARLAAERQVLADARQALARDDVDGALRHLQRHRDTWARGHLVEEREALQVLALARGRRVEAGDAAARFRATWPHSIFLDAIDRALR